MRLKNVHYVPSVNKNLVSGSLLCRDAYKLVFESNKFVISKYGPLLVKAMGQEVCFVYPYQAFAIKLLIIFATIVNPMCGIHVSVMLI